MTRYAERTDVPVEKSRAEIERLLKRYGAGGFMSGWDENRGLATIYFRARDRHVKFVLPLPQPDEVAETPTGRQRSEDQRRRALEQAERQRWRALHLVIKAKLEAVETGIVTFEDEFMAHIVLPDGLTVGEHMQPQIENAYKDGSMPALLPYFGDAE